MRRLIRSAGVALATVALCLTTSPSASAAQGTLTLNGKTYTNPEDGCYKVPNSPPAEVTVNLRVQTSWLLDRVIVFNNPNCSGRGVDYLLFAWSPITRTYPQVESVYVLGNSVEG